MMRSVAGSVVSLMNWCNASLVAFLQLLYSKSDLATSLESAKDHCFVVYVSAANMTALSADPCLIAFDGTRKQIWICLSHCLSDAMTEIPCGLITDSEHSF